jgi:DNA invertase Pin-like site-specific DNA recombinase
MGSRTVFGVTAGYETPNGRPAFHIFGALAEFEHNLVRKRTGAGLVSGRKGLRKPVITPEKLALIAEGLGPSHS